MFNTVCYIKVNGTKFPSVISRERENLSPGSLLFEVNLPPVLSSRTEKNVLVQSSYQRICTAAAGIKCIRQVKNLEMIEM